jgi:hypothetical protein
MKYKPGTKVVVIGDIPLHITALTGLRAGQIGTVLSGCQCLRSEEVKEVFKETFLNRVASHDPHRVQFDGYKACAPAEHLRPILDDFDDDKMVDWKDVPKPWDIGVTDDPRTKKKVH